MRHHIHTAFIAALVAALITLFLPRPAGVPVPSATAEAPARESAYDRVMRTNTLRCGYGIYPPFVTKDANTGAIGGYMADVMKQFEHLTGLKVEWTAEIDWGQLGEALQSGKADAICSTMWGSPQRARAIGFSRPVFFSTVVPIARVDDHRFDANLAIANAVGIKISTNDGDVSEEVAKADFPLATRVAKPQMSGEQQLFMDVVGRKADLTFSAPSLVGEFIAANPDTLRVVPTAVPVRAFANVIGVGIEEDKLLNIINASILTMQNDGTLTRVFGDFMQSHPGHIRLPAQPYQ